MRTRIVLLLAAGAAAAAVSGSGLAAHNPGNPVRGKAYFLRAGLFCGSCHTLKAAKSVGRDGPNLDKAKLSYAKIVAAVTHGNLPSKRWPTGMPHYGAPHAELTKSEIEDVAAFVYDATHR